MATKTPNPSATASSRRTMPPPPPTPAAALSPPFSAAPLRSCLGAAAVGGGATPSSPDEKPCVQLRDWWPKTVDGEERKLAVSGFTEMNEAFTSAPIAKRHEPLVLEDEDVVLVDINGSMSLSRMRESGFSSQKFQLGNSLENLVDNLLNNVADTFLECSRFEEYTCDDDTSTKENYAESNDDRPTPVNNEEDSVETYLIETSPSQQKDNVDNHCNSSFGPTETCSRDETCKETGNQNDTMHPDARSPSQQKDNVDNHCNSSFGPTETCSNDETCKETGNQNDTMHPNAREPEACSHLVNSSLILSTSSDCIPSALEGGKTSAENSEDMASKYLLAAVPPENANFCSDIAGCPSILVASSKNQVYLGRTELIPLSQEAVPQLETSTPVHSDAQSLEQAHHAPLTRARAHSLSISTPESLKMKRTKSETCSNDETCKETGNQNDTMHPDAREPEACSHLVNSSLILSTSPDCIPSDLEGGKTSAENSRGYGV